MNQGLEQGSFVYDHLLAYKLIGWDILLDEFCEAILRKEMC